MMNSEAWFFNPNVKDIIEQSWLTGRAEKVFTPEECAKIIEIGNLQLKESRIGNVNSKVKKEVRDSMVNFLHPEEDTYWIFEKLEQVTSDINDALFHFNIHGFVEGLQFTKYVAPTGQYTAHIDRQSIGEVVRKLSLSVQLSDPSEYDGGELEILTSLEYPEIAPKDQGTSFYFNSHLLHRVTPVTRGTRYSLVAWITGPRFV